MGVRGPRLGSRACRLGQEERTGAAPHDTPPFSRGSLLSARSLAPTNAGLTSPSPHNAARHRLHLTRRGPLPSMDLAGITRLAARGNWQSCPSHRIKPNQNSQQLDNSHLVWTALNTTGIMQLREEMVTFLRRKERQGEMGPGAWGEGKVCVCVGGWVCRRLSRSQCSLTWPAWTHRDWFSQPGMPCVRSSSLSRADTWRERGAS